MYLAAILDGRHLGRMRGGSGQLLVQMLAVGFGRIGPAASRAAPVLAVAVGGSQGQESARARARERARERESERERERERERESFVAYSF